MEDTEISESVLYNKNLYDKNSSTNEERKNC